MSFWFRFYTDARHKAKIQTLPGDLFKHWVNLMTLAKEHDTENGSLPDWPEIAFEIRVTEAEAVRICNDLTSRRLIDVIEDTLYLHDWKDHQYDSDCSTERVRKHRRNKVKRSAKQHGNVSETPQRRVEKSREEPTAADAAITPSVMIADSPPAFELSSSTENQDRDSSYSGRSKIIDEFETEFWPIVWLKVGKDAALKAYRSARKRASCDEIKRGAISLGPLIVRQAAAQHRTPVGPGPWLNAGRWSDSPEVYLTGLDRNGKLSPNESKAAQDREFYKIMQRKGVV